jgi:hypothetical protein
MAAVRDCIDGWRNDPPKVIHRESFQSLGPQPSLAATRCSSHRKEEVSLDNAFALIEGHPLFDSGNSKVGVGPPPSQDE